MDKSIATNIKLGAFVLAGTALLITAIYFIGQKQSMFGNSSMVYAVFRDINGLKPGNNVRYSGINVGSVKDITMVADTVVVIRFGLRKDILPHIKSDAHAIIINDGLVGNMIVNILPGKSTGRPLQGGDTIRSFARIRTDEMLSTLSVTNENAALLTAELLKITRDISGGKGVISSMISDSAIARDLKETIHHLRHTAEASNKALDNINRLVVSLDKNNNLLGMVRDTMLPKTIKQTLSNIENSSCEISVVIRQLNDLIANADTTVTNIRKGRGAINYLSNDRNFVDKVDRTVTDLDSAVLQINNAAIRLNQSLEALRYHWLLKGSFKKMEKEKAGKKE